MWQFIEIENKKHLLKCVLEKDNEAKCLLFDGCKLHSETCSFAEVMQRVKQLNRRIIYQEGQVREVLAASNAELSQWQCDVGNLNGEAEGGRTLSVRYKVGSYPMIFEWHLSRGQDDEYRQYVVAPVYRALKDMQVQNKLLREAVAKKDKEITQYKQEGATLRRTTLHTKPFDFHKFDQQYKASNDLADALVKLSSNVKEGDSMDEAERAAAHIKDDQKIKHENAENKVLGKSGEGSPSSSRSPHNRKRKIREQQQQIILSRLRARRRCLEYESSQSQTQSEEESVTARRRTNPLRVEEAEEEPEATEVKRELQSSQELPPQQEDEVDDNNEMVLERTPSPPALMANRQGLLDSPLGLRLDGITPKASPNSKAYTLDLLLTTPEKPSKAESNDVVDVEVIMRRLQELDRQRLADLQGQRR